MSNEFYKKYRPSKLDQVLGQPEAVETLTNMLNTNSVPRTILFTGFSGIGKTTIARILTKELGCHKSDFVELNCSSARGIETVRDIQQVLSLRPMNGKCRIWLLDECQKLTSDAQSGLLKTLEDTPSHVYFFLATTDPQKLSTAIKTRSTEIKLRKLKDQELETLVNSVLEKEEKTVSEDVINKLIKCSDGSARMCLVLLNQIVQLEGEEKQLSLLEISQKNSGFELARILINPKSKWSDVTSILKNLEDEPETVRYTVLGYANSVLMSKPNKRAYLIICAFESNFYDSKKAGLTRACFEVIENNE